MFSEIPLLILINLSPTIHRDQLTSRLTLCYRNGRNDHSFLLEISIDVKQLV